VAHLVGTVEQLTVYPVKSLAGRGVPAAEVTAAGLVGDRAYAVADTGTGQRLRGKDEPGLAEIVPTGELERDTITLTEVLGRPVRLERAEQPQVDGGAVHLVSRAALVRAAAGDTPEGCSAEDPRANVVLDLSGDADERTWVGRTIRIGAVELRLARTPKHCLGVYAEVGTPGEIRVGAEVLLLD
jgi:uncharacterized protein YcbX